MSDISIKNISKNSNQKIYSIQVMRAIAALMVMLAHFISDGVKYNKISSNFEIYKPFLLRGVDIFFFISGFIITLLYVTKNDSCKQFIKKRAIRILPTYYIFTLIAFGVWLVKPNLFNNSVGNKTDIIASFILIPSKTNYLHLLSVTWTLCFEVWFYAFFALSIAFFRKNILIPITLYAIYLLPFLNLKLFIGNTFSSLINSPYCLEFLSGSLFCSIYSFKNYKAIPGIIIALLGLYIADYNIFIVTLISVSLFLLLELYCKYLPVSQTLILLGDSSYSLYLSHLLVMGVIKHIWDKLNFTGNFMNIIWIISMIVGPIIFNMIYYKFIDLKIVQYLRKKFIA
ncbi:MAG: acyltransferase [Sphingobacteriia bacterium]|nr:acyltransferase [Sphingobacteriia bacterium]